MYYYLAVLFSTIAVPILIKIVKAFGIGAVTYVGINQVMSVAAGYIESQLGATTAMMQSMLGVAKVDVAINIYLAAITTRMVLSGMNQLTGRKKDFVLKA